MFKMRLSSLLTVAERVGSQPKAGANKVHGEWLFLISHDPMSYPTIKAMRYMWQSL